MQNKFKNIKDNEIPSLWRFILKLEDRIVRLENGKEVILQDNEVSAFDDLKNFENPNQSGKTLMETFSEEILEDSSVDEKLQDYLIKENNSVEENTSGDVMQDVEEETSVEPEYLNPMESRYFIPHIIKNNMYKSPDVDYFMDAHFKCFKQIKLEHEPICEFCHLLAMHVSHRSYENLGNEHYEDVWSLCDWHFREVSERVDVNGQPPHPPFSPKWLAISPTGHTFQVVSLKKFAKANKLHSGTLGRLASGKQQNYKGWKCYGFASYITNLYAQQSEKNSLPGYMRDE